jgi:cytochrome c-type protein NapC
MLRVVILGTALVAIVVGMVLYFNADRLAGSRAGRLAVLLGVLGLPLVSVTGGVGHAVSESSSTPFCLSCHEMNEHGRSLFVDDMTVLPAVHYQKRLIDRDQICYACHTDYAMFGEFKAKLNGLKHVWVHYLGDPPAPENLELYAPYPNRNCLHCHDDARSYLEAAPHQGQFEALRADERSCLECHSRGHAIEQVKEGNFWLAQ